MQLISLMTGWGRWAHRPPTVRPNKALQQTGAQNRVGLRDGWSLSLRIYELPWREERRGESPDEREMRRKAADRKPGVPVP